MPTHRAPGRWLAATGGRGEVRVGACVERLAARHGLRRCARIVRYDAGVYHAADGEEVRGVGAVLFATGYHNRYDFVRIDGALDAAGQPVHDGGRSPVDGLYWMG